MGMIAFVPFTINSNASKSSPVDLGANNIIVGVSIHGTWTAAKISFEGYVQDTATQTNPADPTQSTETGALFDAIKDGNGTQYSWGDGTAISAQMIVPTPTISILAPRFVKVVSGTTAALVTQSQKVTGYILTRA